jgi:hypothetical protein
MYVETTHPIHYIALYYNFLGKNMVSFMKILGMHYSPRVSLGVEQPFPGSRKP